ncbi:MAG TPA: 6,7-dimethyl-8-ribityllumazine synthase [Bryobacteraceae bacterium]|nr:6,7-dimethyl-8-ribityllumazine synthase [Bryobacteraceae bacterium]
MTEGKPIQEQLDARGLKFAVVCARFNGEITERLLAGALDALKRAGASERDIEIAKVPGSWELPLAAATLAHTKNPDAIIALGAVIRGDTPHFDYVAGEASRGLMDVQLETGIPVAFGVLTTNTMEQATNRAGGKDGNKGYDAAITAIEMAGWIRRLRE